MLIVAAAVAALPVVVVVEAMLARRGAEVDTPDVETLTVRHGPDGAQQALRLVWLGDSTAAAVGTTDAQHAVSTRVGERLSQACTTAVTTRVIAKSGARLDDVVRDQVPRAREIGGDIALISVGANDTTHLTSPTRFARLYRDLIEGLVDAGFAHDRIVLVGVPDMGSPPRLLQPLRALVGWRSRALDARVEAVAHEKRASYVDLFAGTSAAFRADPGRYFAADKYHPSDDGYAVWARVITPVVKELCG